MFPFNKNNHQQPPQQPPSLGGDEFTPPTQQPPKPYTQYSPYKDLQTNNNLFYGQQVYNLPTTVESLFEEESQRRGRTFSENSTFYTGTSFLLGSVGGGVKGTFQGINAAEYGDSAKIRVNRVLNSGGLVGRRVGNRMGVLGLLYSGFSGGIAYKFDNVGDDMGSVLAGAGTGALFRVFGGVRSAVAGGVVGGAVVAALVGGRLLADKYVPALSLKI